MNSSETDILLVEDSPDDAELALHALRREHIANNIIVVRDGEEALDFIFCRGPFAERSFEQPPKLILLDLKLPKVDGIEVLKQIKDHAPDTLVILLTAYSSVETAVEAMRQGAYHYVNKPFNLDEIALLVAKALETTALRREVRALRASQAQPYSLDRFVGDDESVLAMRALIRKIAAARRK